MSPQQRDSDGPAFLQVKEQSGTAAAEDHYRRHDDARDQADVCSARGIGVLIVRYCSGGFARLGSGRTAAAGASVGLPVLLSDGVLPVVSPFRVVVPAELSFVVVSCCGAVVVSSGCGEVGSMLSSALTG